MKNKPRFQSGDSVWIRGKDGKVHKQLSQRLLVTGCAEVTVPEMNIHEEIYYDVQDSNKKEDKGRFTIKFLIGEPEMVGLRLMGEE